MESEAFRYILLALLMPLAGFKIYKIYRKLNNLSKAHNKKLLEKSSFINEN